MAGPDVPPPPAPVGPSRQKRSRLSWQLRAQASEVDATRGKYDHNSDVQSQAQMEHVFAEYFGGLVSEWNPCYDADGNVRYFWDEEVGAHDVEVTGGVSAACPERARLRTVLDRVFREEELDAKTGQAKPVDLTPVRRLVAALVESSGRHKLHLRCAPKLVFTLARVVSRSAQRAATASRCPGWLAAALGRCAWIRARSSVRGSRASRGTIRFVTITSLTSSSRTSGTSIGDRV